MIVDNNHLYKLIKYGVYFGYSTDSILEFTNNFGNAYEIIDGKLFDYRIKGATNGTGHMCSWYEAITLSGTEMTEQINAKRYCNIPFPWDDNIKFDKERIDNETTALYRNNFMYRREVEQLFNYIKTNLDVVLEQE